VKDSERYIKSIQDINHQNEDYLLSVDAVNVFINAPMEELLQVVRNRLNTEPSFPECSPLQVEEVMELLGICLTTYFQFEDKFYQQKEGTSVENSLSLVIVIYT
jgi:hypothetical protein